MVRNGGKDGVARWYFTAMASCGTIRRRPPSIIRGVRDGNRVNRYED